MCDVNPGKPNPTEEPMPTTMSKNTKQATKARKDAYSIVTDRMIEALENGTNPWRRPWVGGSSGGYPVSAATGKQYRGVNVLLLWMTAQQNGYASPYWMTYKQARKQGGHVRKGEKGTTVVFWKVINKTEKDIATGEDMKRKMFFLRTFTVFNADQCDGLPEKFVPQPEGNERDEHEVINAAQAIVDGFEKGPTIAHTGNRAAYRLREDVVTMPKPEKFHTGEDYYATLFHELTHSTGHESRLNRHNEDEYKFHRFGDPEYTREELVAEMGSAFLCAIAGIDNEQITANSAAYFAGWAKKLKDDPKLVIHAAGAAQRAVDHILGAKPYGEDEDDQDATTDE